VPFRRAHSRLYQYETVFLQPNYYDFYALSLALFSFRAIMSKIKLYIATSLDGFIARPDGSLDWLESLPNPNQIDHGYHDFYASIGVVIMGRSTYEEILGFGVPWPYSNCTSYVVTQNKNYKLSTPDTELLAGIDKGVIRSIQEVQTKDIWLVGGGKIITEFLNLQLIDEMILSIAPVILGSGIPLFPGVTRETSFKLVGAEKFETGIVNLFYSR
jgi:dihydrofolate reductase